MKFVCFDTSITYFKFQPNNVAPELDMIRCKPLDGTRKKIQCVTLLEVVLEIDTNINPKENRGFDKISLHIIKN